MVRVIGINDPTVPVTQTNMAACVDDKEKAIPKAPVDPAWRSTNKSVKAKLKYIGMHVPAFQDVTFVVGKEHFPVHKLIFIIGSGTFEKKFADEWAGESEIQITDITPQAFKALVKFFYTDEFEDRSCSCEYVLDVLVVAKEFDVPELASRCVGALQGNISEANVVGIFERALKLKEVELQKLTTEFIARHMNKVIMQNQFANDLKIEGLKYILKMDELVVDELALFHGVLRWAKQQCKSQELEETSENLRHVLQDTLNYIRFPLLDTQQFTQFVVSAEVLTSIDTLDLYRMFTLPDGPQKEQLKKNGKFSCKPRRRQN